MKRKNLLASLLALGIGTAAMAADGTQEAPKTVGPFVSFCATNFRACSNEVASVDIANSLTQAPDKTTCLIPRGVTDDDSVRAVVAWLAQHGELAASSTSDGVTAAIKGVWSCAAEIPNGKTRNGAPENTAAFLAHCASGKFPNRCANVVVGTSMRAYAASIGIDNGDKGHCSIPDSVQPLDASAQVIAWLQQHSETHALDIEDTTVTAIDALWPCH